MTFCSVWVCGSFLKNSWGVNEPFHDFQKECSDFLFMIEWIETSVNVIKV